MCMRQRWEEPVRCRAKVLARLSPALCVATRQANVTVDLGQVVRAVRVVWLGAVAVERQRELPRAHGERGVAPIRGGGCDVFADLARRPHQRPRRRLAATRPLALGLPLLRERVARKGGGRDAQSTRRRVRMLAAQAQLYCLLLERVAAAAEHDRLHLLHLDLPVGAAEAPVDVDHPRQRVVASGQVSEAHLVTRRGGWRRRPRLRPRARTCTSACTCARARAWARACAAAGPRLLSLQRFALAEGTLRLRLTPQSLQRGKERGLHLSISPSLSVLPSISA